MTHISTPAASGTSVVVLASGTGSLTRGLLAAAGSAVSPEHGMSAGPFTVAAVVSDRVEAGALAHAREFGVPTAVVAPSDFPDRATWDVAVTRAVGVFDPDLVVLAGFMRLLGEPFLAAYGGRTLNTHPSLLPAFAGAHGVRDALDYGVKVSGCTVILVDAGPDTGPVVAQRAVPVLAGDDEETLHERIKVVERELLVDVVTRMVRDGWSVDGRKVTLA